MKHLLGLTILVLMSFGMSCKSSSQKSIDSPEATAYLTQHCRMMYCCQLGECPGADEGLCVSKCVKYHKQMGGAPVGQSLKGNSLASASKAQRNFMKHNACISKHSFSGMCVGKPLSEAECTEIKDCLRELP